MKIKVNTEFLSLDLLFIISLKKSTDNSQGLICLSNNSVSRAIMYKERKQIISKSLDSIRYLYLHDALPPDFPSKFENIKHLRNLYFQFQQNKTNGLDVTKICTLGRQLSESKLPLITTDEILQSVSKFEKINIRHLTWEYQHESSLERFYGHFDSKGCFFRSNPTIFPNRCVNQIIMQLLKSCRKFCKISLFIGKIKKG